MRSLLLDLPLVEAAWELGERRDECRLQGPGKSRPSRGKDAGEGPEDRRCRSSARELVVFFIWKVPFRR